MERQEFAQASATTNGGFRVALPLMAPTRTFDNVRSSIAIGGSRLAAVQLGTILLYHRRNFTDFKCRVLDITRDAEPTTIQM